MPDFPINPPIIWRRLCGLAVVLWLVACSPAGAAPPPAISPTPSQTEADAFSEIPDAARVVTRVGDPRPAVYWALWNSCAPENRATQAAANGGRAAGFILLDDLLSYPGIKLGDYLVATCQAGLDLLQGGTAAEEPTGDPLYSLAGQLLTAELNLGVGAETCPIAEEAVLGGHLVLSEAGFDGSGAAGVMISEEVARAIPRLVELLEGYNRGELCR